MLKRVFSLRSTGTALQYIDWLMKQGIIFKVIPRTDRVDIETPFELDAADFPLDSWLKGRTE